MKTLTSTNRPRGAATKDQVSPSRALPTPGMAEQFEAYMRWVQGAGISPFYAFTASVPD